MDSVIEIDRKGSIPISHASNDNPYTGVEGI